MLPMAQTVLLGLQNLLPLFDASPTVTVTLPVTPTVGLEATPVPAVAIATPEPVAAAVSAWNPGQWLHVTGWTTDFHTPFLVFYLFVAIAAVVAYFVFFQRVYKDHKLRAHMAERVSVALTVFATVGVILLVFAVARTPLFSLPLWLILSLVAFIAFIVYCVYYYVNVYPHALVKYEHELERARYIPKGKTKGPAYTPPMKRKQKQNKPDKNKKK
jgi:hypothetical protein